MATDAPSSESRPVPAPLPRVLLVEDETLQATMLRVLLLDRGLLVIHAQNLRQALDLVEHERIAAAVLDITLADADVYPVAERLRAKRIPFFFASGAEAYEIDPAFADVPLVHKPYRIDQVHALLDRLLGLAESSASR
jgi:DNA-binding response OmpR family regulator